MVAETIDDTDSAIVLRDADIEVQTTRDSGPGGQHRNKTESCVVMTHRPTGIQAKSALKSQHQNRRLAREALEARVQAHYAEQAAQDASRRRQRLAGSGQRADKIRTYRVQDGRVIDHRRGRKAPLAAIRQGKLERVWGE